MLIGVSLGSKRFIIFLFGFLGFVIMCYKHPTARIVSQVRGKVDDRAEAPAGGLCRTRVFPHSKHWLAALAGCNVNISYY